MRELIPWRLATDAEAQRLIGCIKAWNMATAPNVPIGGDCYVRDGITMAYVSHDPPQVAIMRDREQLAIINADCVLIDCDIQDLCEAFRVEVAWRR